VIALRREAAGEPEGALVLFHGRGTSEHDLHPLLDELDPQRRRLGVTLRAPLELSPGGFHWYIVRQVGFPDPATFLPTFAEVSAWLDAFAEETGIPAGKTVLGGFSQGAVMSYALGLGQGRPRPQAIVVMSGFIPQVDGFELELSPPLPPVAIAHGTYDPVISVEFGRQAKELLERAGADVLYREGTYPHTVDPQFLREVAAWLP
jgi:phospholipase/carboxylesterase